jgi:hypothetical protein
MCVCMEESKSDSASYTLKSEAEQWHVCRLCTGYGWVRGYINPLLLAKSNFYTSRFCLCTPKGEEGLTMVLRPSLPKFKHFWAMLVCGGLSFREYAASPAAVSSTRAWKP